MAKTYPPAWKGPCVDCTDPGCWDWVKGPDGKEYKASFCKQHKEDPVGRESRPTGPDVSPSTLPDPEEPKGEQPEGSEAGGEPEKKAKGKGKKSDKKALEELGEEG